MTKYRIAGGRLILPSGIEKKDLLLANGQIEAIVDANAAVSNDYTVISCNGRYVSAGFVDIHQHGGGGADYMDAKPDTYQRATSLHLAHGTTSVMPTLLSATAKDLLRAIECYKLALRDTSIKTNLIGLHIEGTYISPQQAGAQKPEHIRRFDPTEYRAIVAAAEGEIKRWSVAPEVEGAEEFARFAGENGITLSIAHSNADIDTVRRAFAWGFCHVTHLYSCTSTITRRGGFRVPGVLEAAYLIDDMDVEIIADGCHLPQDLLAYVAKFKSHDRIALITDAIRAAGMTEGESHIGSDDDPLPVLIEDGVAKLTDRSAFAGSIATADRLIRNMRESGVDLCDAVKMVTENPIRMMKLPIKKGRLAAGYDADVCIFDEDIVIEHVLSKGELVNFC